VLLSPLDISNLYNKVAHFIAVKVRHWSNSVYVSDEIIHFAKEGVELSITIVSTKQVTSDVTTVSTKRGDGQSSPSKQPRIASK
jgi:hypothetical protein